MRSRLRCNVFRNGRTCLRTAFVFVPSNSHFIYPLTVGATLGKVVCKVSEGIKVGTVETRNYLVSVGSLVITTVIRGRDMWGRRILHSHLIDTFDGNGLVDWWCLKSLVYGSNSNVSQRSPPLGSKDTHWKNHKRKIHNFGGLHTKV